MANSFTQKRAEQYLLAACLTARATDKGENVYRHCLDAAELVRHARKIDHVNEVKCSVQIDEPYAKRLDRAMERAQKACVDIAAKYGAKCHFGGDPRGVAVRLYWPDMIPVGRDPDCYTDRMLAVNLHQL